MKRMIAPLLTACLLMTLAGAAFAQSSQSTISVKVGGFFPTNSSASKNGGSSQLSAGLDYAVPSPASNGTTSLPSVYFDYNGGSKNGGHVDTYGLGFAIRTQPNSTTTAAAQKMGISPYVGLGIGYYEVQVKNTDVVPTESGSKGTIGGKAFVGVNLTNSFFVEANYQLISSTKGVNPSGFGAQVGVRF